MKVILPTDNKITQGFNSNHRAYDFAGRNLPDPIRAIADGQIVEITNRFSDSWINNGTLTTRDYGNYIIIKHTDGTRSLYAHLKQDSMLNIGTQVKGGQIVAKIGNTGNSTGPHLHLEIRDAFNKNIPVEFISYTPLPIKPPMNDIERKKLVQFDRTVIALKDAGYLSSAASEQFFENPMDEDKFTNLIKKLIRDAQDKQATSIELGKAEEKGRKKGIQESKDHLNKLV